MTPDATPRRQFQFQAQGFAGSRIDQPAPSAHLSPPMATSPFAGYAPGPGHDELLAGDGVMRPHWRALSDWFATLGEGEFAGRRDQARRLIRENGVTYNVYGAGQGRSRPWQLDPLPLLLPAAEWTALAAGVAQRARLLDAVLADVYGQQRLLQRQ